MITAFYAPPSSFRGAHVVLPDDEARHAAASLRKEAGDEIVVVDGDGGWHRVRLNHVSPDQVVGSVVESRQEVGEPHAPVTLGMALLKQRSRFETFAEKAAELGVAQIVPLHTARTEPESLRMDRVRNILVAAMKQCGRSRLPALAEPQSLEATWSDDRRWLLCHESAPASRTIRRVLVEIESEAPVGILVGPEGGFTDAEVEAARQAGAEIVSLGPRRLRAETAGIVAASAVALLREVLHGPEDARSV